MYSGCDGVCIAAVTGLYSVGDGVYVAAVTAGYIAAVTA